ncbi:YybH family protein [Mucilaginibacter sp.]
MSNFQSQADVEALIYQQTKAIRNKDIAGATANYKADVILFDVVGPLQHQGAVSVKQRLKEWFSTLKADEPISFETVNLTVSADNDIAFSYGINHINALLKNDGKLNMYWRETLCWQKVEERWQIVLAHSSVPFDANTGMASTGLKPFSSGVS